MKPKASLKSLNTKVRAIASRPVTSVQPDRVFRADLRASADSRSTMIVSHAFPELYLNTASWRRFGNHEGVVTRPGKEFAILWSKLCRPHEAKPETLVWEIHDRR